MDNRASFGERLGAAFIDTVIVSIVSGVFGLILGSTLGMLSMNSSEVEVNSFGDLLSDFFSFFIYTIYFVTIPFYKNGQTLGKKICGIRIQKQDGQKPSLFTLLFREMIGKLLSTLILLIGYLMALRNNRLALHDIMAKTEVVKVNRNKEL